MDPENYMQAAWRTEIYSKSDSKEAQGMKISTEHFPEIEFLHSKDHQALQSNFPE